MNYTIILYLYHIDGEDNDAILEGRERRWGGAYAPINVNPVKRECGQGVGIWQILKFLDQIRQGGKGKVDQKCQKSSHPCGKNLNKQYYNTI